MAMSKGMRKVLASKVAKPAPKPSDSVMSSRKPFAPKNGARPLTATDARKAALLKGLKRK